MATKTLGTGGDYTTFAAAVAGIATWDKLNVITAGTYAEAAALPTISKTVEFVNLSGGKINILTPVGQPIGSVSGGPVTVTWTGDFDMQIRKGGANIEYHWLLGGNAGVDNKLVFDGCTFTSDYTTGLTQVVYQTAARSHEFYDCTAVGVYDCLVTVGTGKCNTSVIDGLTVTGSVKYVVHGNTAGDLFGTFDHRRIFGNITNCPYNAGIADISVTTSGLLTTSRMWGLDGMSYTQFGTGAIAVEKSVFTGSRAYGFAVFGTALTATTFRDCEFGGFSSHAVKASGAAMSNLVDYCGAGNGCPALCDIPGDLGAHNQISDPLFVDYAGHDYHLLAGSPRIDTGTACIATVDPDGNTIPSGGGYDIGTFELVPFVTPVTYDSEYTSGATIICTDLSGTPIPGYNPYDLFPAINDPLVSLAQIVLVSLFSDRVAGYDDELPAGQVDRRGWFADTAEEKTGSRLWLDEGAAVVDDTLDRNRRWVEESLAHLTRDGLATAVEIEMDIAESETNPAEAMLLTQITVRLDEDRGVILKFPDLWGL